MARINVEDKWWSDPRRMMLTAKLGVGTADGVWLNAIRLAQDFGGESFDPTGKLMPEWVEALCSVGLAVASDGLLYVKGSREHHEWIKEQRERGRKGGESNKQRIKKLHEATAKPRPRLSKANAKPSSSSSSSLEQEQSILSELIGPVPGLAVVPAEDLMPSKHQTQVERTRRLVATYCEAFKARYGHNPTVLSREAGILGRIAKDLSEQRAREMIQGFLQLDGERGFLVTKKHDLGLLEGTKNQITVALHKGRETSGIDEAAERKAAMLWRDPPGHKALP